MVCMFITAYAAIGCGSAAEASRDQPPQPAVAGDRRPPSLFIHPAEGERLGGDVILAFRDRAGRADRRRAAGSFDWADFEAREVDRIYRKLLRYTEQPARGPRGAGGGAARPRRRGEPTRSRCAPAGRPQSTPGCGSRRWPCFAASGPAGIRRKPTTPPRLAPTDAGAGKEHGPRIAAHGNATYWGELSDEVMARPSRAASSSPS